MMWTELEATNETLPEISVVWMLSLSKLKLEAEIASDKKTKRQEIASKDEVIEEIKALSQAKQKHALEAGGK